MARLLSSAILALVCVAAGVPAAAQQASETVATPAHIGTVQGAAILERNGVGEAASENLPLLEGDRLRTESGRLEILLPDGSVLDLDQRTTVDLLAGGLIRVTSGRLLFVVAGAGEGGARRDYQVDTRAAIVRLTAGGEYRVATEGTSGAPGIDVSVVSGQAFIDADGASLPVSAGQRVRIAEGQGITSSGFNSAEPDPFYDWAETLRGDRVGVQSNAYLPSDLRAYGGTFDRDGTWQNDTGKGWVWYPRVSSEWRPYYDGYWEPYDWGWTWVGTGAWTWPTHHYGRWGHGARGWFWVPGSLWSPGWVSWGGGLEYLGWCPLGLDDGPVFDLPFGISSGSRPGAWSGWTVVPHDGFGHGRRVPAFALRAERLSRLRPDAFSKRHSGPDLPGGQATRRADTRSSRAGYDAWQGGRRNADGRAWGGNPAPRPSVGQRQWTTGQDSAYGRAQNAAAERLRGPGRAVGDGAATPSRGVDTAPFSSPSPSGLPYPDRFRSSIRPPSGDSLSDAASRASSSRSGSRPSRRYYLGPSEPTGGSRAPSQASPRAGAPAGPASRGGTGQGGSGSPGPRRGGRESEGGQDDAAKPSFAPSGAFAPASSGPGPSAMSSRAPRGWTTAAPPESPSDSPRPVGRLEPGRTPGTTHGWSFGASPSSPSSSSGSPSSSGARSPAAASDPGSGVGGGRTPGKGAPGGSGHSSGGGSGAIRKR